MKGTDPTRRAAPRRRSTAPSGGPVSEDKWEYRQALAFFIRRLPTARRRLLEIGAGSGRFVVKVSPSMVPRNEVIATEFSDYGIEELRRLGVTAVKRDFRNLSPERCAGAFDVTCPFQVLEHLDDLDGAFRKLRELWNDGGFVVLSTPSDARIRFNEANGALMDMPPNHLTLWCRTAIERLATRKEIRLVEHRYEPRSFLRDSLLFLRYRFLRAAQRRRSVPNTIGSLKNARARRGLSALWLRLPEGDVVDAVTGGRERVRVGANRSPCADDLTRYA